MVKHNSDYFSSFKEAQKAYSKWKTQDPLSSIPPALLSSADISDYVRLTGMIYPFHQKDLIGATYSVRLKGLCVYYKEAAGPDNPAEHIFCIGKDEEDLPNVTDNRAKGYEVREKLVLEPNSITFVTLEPVFQVPDYLVFRFNLKIPHIYKGLLLGTGPIIDPGFQGRLSIPLHNLTSNKYTFSEDDEIISLEITKMNPYPTLHGYRYLRQGNYKPTSITPHRQVTEYLSTALGPCSSDGIVSSVIAATNDIRQIAKDAEKKAAEAINTAGDAVETANTTDMKIGRWGITSTVIALVAIFASAIGLIFSLLLPSYQLVVSVKDTQVGYETRISELENEIADLKQELENLIAEKSQTGNTQEEGQTEPVQQGGQEAISDEN